MIVMQNSFDMSLFCEIQWPRSPLFSPSSIIQWSMGEGCYITLFSPSDVTAFHRILVIYALQRYLFLLLFSFEKLLQIYFTIMLIAIRWLVVDTKKIYIYLRMWLCVFVYIVLVMKWFERADVNVTQEVRVSHTKTNGVQCTYMCVSLWMGGGGGVMLTLKAQTKY